MTDAKLHSADEALLKAAATGEGLVELTPDLLEKISHSIRKRTTDIAERYPQLVNDCPEETRLAVAAWVIEAIVEHATEGGSFLTLIYDRLGFGPDAYLPLYNAGGMIVSDEFDLREQREEEQSQALSMWVIYDHPSDWPDFFVARRWLFASIARATGEVLLCEGIDEMRRQLAGRGLARIERSEADDPTIREVWL